ncbi:helix-turn-helix domain-containing protein [Roseibium sp. RKSG952]|uniref:winged helix-turn-helix domain-containing protein n=1 Tax=Roseibium sp. RKSG952 TaxID=2529384 RepID=UPI0012BD607B|nr:helix-turn-helix domain-containing protein [Roseibium sp. RKSG952]MTH94906.1 helix-turn-helix domain-containing protein [Roseibium sp. RKSG952]
MLCWLWTRLSEAGPSVFISGRALRRFPDGEVDRLVRARVLIEQRKADTWSVCAHCDCGLDARPIRTVGGSLRACCPYDPAADVLLEPDDLRRFAINADQLIAAIVASGGWPAVATVAADGLWLLGRLPTGICVFLCRDTHLLMAPATIHATRMAAGPVPIIVICNKLDPTTELHLRAAGIEARSFAECVRLDDRRSEHIAIERLSPSVVTKPRLILRRSCQALMFDGQRLDLTPQMFALIRLFVEQVGQRDPVLRKETIEARTGRAANEIVRDLRKALVGCGLSRAAADALIVTVRGYGYRLGVAPSEVAPED